VAKIVDLKFNRSFANSIPYNHPFINATTCTFIPGNESSPYVGNSVQCNLNSDAYNTAIYYDRIIGKLPLNNICVSPLDFWPSTLFVGHLQGCSVSADGTKMAIIQSSSAGHRIDLVNMADKEAILASNTSPYSAPMFDGLDLDHIGDPTFAIDPITGAEVLLAPVEDGFTPGADMHCAIYNATTLEFIRAFPLTVMEDGVNECCSVTVRDGVIYIASWNTQVCFWKYDFSGNYLGKFPITLGASRIQGLSWNPDSEIFTVSCGTAGDGKSYIIIDKYGNHVGAFVDHAVTGSGNIEGHCYDSFNKCYWICREPGGQGVAVRVYQITPPTNGFNSGITVEAWIRLRAHSRSGLNSTLVSMRNSADITNCRWSSGVRRLVGGIYPRALSVWSAWGGHEENGLFYPQLGVWYKYRWEFTAFRGIKCYVGNKIITYQDEITTIAQEKFDEFVIGGDPWLTTESAQIDVASLKIWNSAVYQDCREVVTKDVSKW